MRPPFYDRANRALTPDMLHSVKEACDLAGLPDPEEDGNIDTRIPEPTG
jgi:hypothetical protein